MPDEPRPDDELPEDTVDPELDGDDTVNAPEDAYREVVLADEPVAYWTLRDDLRRASEPEPNDGPMVREMKAIMTRHLA